MIGGLLAIYSDCSVCSVCAKKYKVEECNRMARTKEEPAPAILQKDQQDVLKLYEEFRKHKAKLVSPEGQVTTLPASLHGFLVELFGQLSDGRPVSIVQGDAKLSTVDAATILGMSRQFLVNMLEKGEIPHHKVGTHRRIYARDLFQYKMKRDSARRSALGDLVSLEVDEGLYGREPADEGQ
jgi:excisionase family DNA binding protein